MILVLGKVRQRTLRVCWMASLALREMGGKAAQWLRQPAALAEDPVRFTAPMASSSPLPETLAPGCCLI